VSNEEEPKKVASSTSQGGLAQILLATLIAGLVALVVAFGNWVHNDMADLRKEVSALRGELLLATEETGEIKVLEGRFILLIDRLNDREAQEFEVICNAVGRYDPNKMLCTFDDGRPSLVYKPLEK
jgi:hypothetical protein